MNTKELSNEHLADMLRVMKSTGISTSQLEKEALDEAADRIEKIDDLDLELDMWHGIAENYKRIIENVYTILKQEGEDEDYS